MIEIDTHLLDALTEKAKGSPRLRMNHNFHSSMDDTMHRMLNAMEPGTYVQPHKHENPDKTEAFIILRGTIAIIKFSDDGLPLSCHILNSSRGLLGLEIPPRTWHSLISLETGSIVYELKHGPYQVSTDKNFAPWAPAENVPEAAFYLSDLIKTFKLEVYEPQ
ncbi:MAG: WbuC family cupin fold metalloprotein [Cytophagaceae bacterium]